MQHTVQKPTVLPIRNRFEGAKDIARHYFTTLLAGGSEAAGFSRGRVSRSAGMTAPSRGTVMERASVNPASQLPARPFGASCEIRALAPIQDQVFATSLPAERFNTAHRVLLAERVGCGRGVRLAEITALKHQTCGNAQLKVLDPVSVMRGRVANPAAFAFTANAYDSGRGQGVLVDPDSVQWMRSFGRFGVSDLMNKTLKHLDKSESFVAPRLRGDLCRALQITGALEHAVVRLPQDFDAQDLYRELIEPYGDHVVMGGVVGVASFKSLLSREVSAQQAKKPADKTLPEPEMSNPANWALQSVRLEPIAKFLTAQAIEKLSGRAAGRDFLANQSRSADGVSNWRAVDVDWVG